MNPISFLASVFLLLAATARADPALDAIRDEIEALKKRVAALEDDNRRLRRQIDVERLVVRKELIVSDTGEPWEKGYEPHQIPRGIYARSLGDGPGGSGSAAA